MLTMSRRPIFPSTRILAGLLWLFFAHPVQAKDYFDFNREQAVSRLEKVIDKLGVVAPMPELECKPNPATLRYCYAQIRDRVKLGVVETILEGKVYELTVEFVLNKSTLSGDELFDNLCTAMILVLRPSLGPDGARRRYSTALRRAVNKSAKKGFGTETVVGNPDTLVVDAFSGHSFVCTISAEDDHRNRN